METYFIGVGIYFILSFIGIYLDKSKISDDELVILFWASLTSWFGASVMLFNVVANILQRNKK